MAKPLSVVLPAFNESGSIGTAVHAALAVAGRGEVIVVDDGSSDRTASIVAELAHPNVRLLRHPANLGYGAAVMTGIRAARHEHIFLTDADLQFDVAEVARLTRWVPDYDIIVGYRDPRMDHWVRRFNGWSWNALLNALFGLGVRDVDCAFKIFHRRVFDGLSVKSLGAFVSGEILVRATAAGFRIKQVPVSHYPRRSGIATGNNVRVITRGFVELGSLYRELRSL